MRKTITAIAAAVAIGTAAMATGALAAPPHPHGGHWGGHFGGHFRGHFRVGPGLFLYGGPLYYGDSCYQWERVLTPRGWRLRRVWVCD